VSQGKVFQPKFDRGLKQGGQHAQQRKQLLTGRPQEQVTLDQPQSLQNFRNILEGQSSHEHLSVRKSSEAKSGRWGVGLTASKMRECHWLKPVLVGQFEFAEWTGDSHLRHSKFIALREDKDPLEVRRE
jgi:ATP-dependent DNA ligase